MNKINNLDATAAEPVKSHPKSGLEVLENIAGFVEDMNNQNMKRLSDPAALDALVKERFGPDVSIDDVAKAFEALNELSAAL
jgi:hypothetical protein